MFDFHMHSKVSFDGKADAEQMAKAAAAKGLQAICFTDHIDHDPRGTGRVLAFDTDDYIRTYENLHMPGLEICRGMEFGLLPDNREDLKKELTRFPFDFVIGSIHFVDGLDPYFPEFWVNTTVESAELRYFEAMLECVRIHDDFDVLGHMTFISKCRANPVKRPVRLSWYQELIDEIMKQLIQKGKGIELNTSGVDRCGVYLPDEAYLRRFRELGGDIVTVGSDAHNADRVGQYCREAGELVQSIFGYVCTFRQRKAVFHK